MKFQTVFSVDDVKTTLNLKRHIFIVTNVMNPKKLTSVFRFLNMMKK